MILNFGPSRGIQNWNDSIRLAVNYLFIFASENNVKIASDDDAMGKVCKALRLHMNSAEVAEAASAALLSLTLNGRNTASCIHLM